MHLMDVCSHLDGPEASMPLEKQRCIFVKETSASGMAMLSKYLMIPGSRILPRDINMQDEG